MLVIREMTAPDIDPVAVVHVRSWQRGYAGIVPGEVLDALDPADFAARRRAYSPPPGAMSLVAVRDSTIVGLATFGPRRSAGDGLDQRHGQLYAIYVDPDHWGTGAGRQLLAEVRARMAAAGFADLVLWVLEENHQARRFYERAGLTPDGAREFYTPPGSTVELPELRYGTPL